RARVRMIQHHIASHLYGLATTGLGQGRPAQAARKELQEELLGLARMFPARGFFMGNDMTVVDTAWAPLMWRLPSLGIALDSVDGMRAYADRLFARGAFQRSLSSVERNLAA
ncbi:MAG: stringent starvation protein A, partial [Proteobacteria bacterium]|nr:stringent starvation protein A [Pseudomonadota bacterium]